MYGKLCPPFTGAHFRQVIMTFRSTIMVDVAATSVHTTPYFLSSSFSYLLGFLSASQSAYHLSAQDSRTGPESFSDVTVVLIGPFPISPPSSLRSRRRFSRSLTALGHHQNLLRRLESLHPVIVRGYISAPVFCFLVSSFKIVFLAPHSSMLFCSPPSADSVAPPR